MGDTVKNNLLRTPANSLSPQSVTMKRSMGKKSDGETYDSEPSIRKKSVSEKSVFNNRFSETVWHWKAEEQKYDCQNSSSD